MSDLSESIKNFDDAQIFKPDGYEQFFKYLHSCTTEEQLFSRLTYWMTFRGPADDQNERLDKIRQRAEQLNLWRGLDLRVESWQRDTIAEIKRIGEDGFNALAGQDFEKFYNNQHPIESSDSEVFTAQELAEMDIPPQQFIVDGLIPMGVGVLVAKPKVGKSFMVFDLCLSVAAGEPFLGCRTHQHGALYLALEDGKGRLQDRMQKVLNKRPIPPAMRFLIDAPRIGEGLEEKLGAILDKNPDIGLVCIDTLSLVKPKERAFENVYSADYSFMRVFKKITESRGICILLVHHTRKGKNTNDAFDSINGSTGIMGASDFSMVLDKDDRNEADAILSITGRDIEQQEQVVRFDKASFRWTMQGSAAEIAEQNRIAEYENSPIVKVLRIILQQGDGTWSGNSQKFMEVAQQYTPEELAPSSQALAKSLHAMEPLLMERDAIKYDGRRKGTGGTIHTFRMFRTDNTPDLPPNEQISLQ